MIVKYKTEKGNWINDQKVTLVIDTKKRQCYVPETDTLIQLEETPGQQNQWSTHRVFIDGYERDDFTLIKFPDCKYWDCLCAGVHRSSHCAYEAVAQLYFTLH